MSYNVSTTRLWRLWSDTDTRIESLARSVDEGVQVDEASNFCRWIHFSCLLEILEANEQDVPLPIRGHELRRKVEALISECNEWYRKHGRSNMPRDAYVSQSKLATIEAELAAIRAALTDTCKRPAESLPVVHVLEAPAATSEPAG